VPTVTSPSVCLPDHRVTTDELVDHFAEVYRGHHRLHDALRVMRATTVDERRLSRPLARLSDPATPVARRMHEHFEDTCRLALRAARRALAESGLDAAEIRGLVCASTTGYAMPGLDVYLANRLALPPTTRRIPVTQLGCDGGAYAIARAAEQHRLGLEYVLVVCADLFGPWTHPADTGMDAMIFRALMGDAAAACVVGPPGWRPGLTVTGTWDYTVPGTAHIVGTRVEADGMHLFNSPELFQAVETALLDLRAWLEERAPDGTDPMPEFLVAHPGGPRVMQVMLDVLKCRTERLDASRQSLRELGNAGSVSVLDVLARTYAAPPAAGTNGLVLGVGPGVTITACTTTWRSAA
jgi:predicted naringenin-chalcone synthase